MLRKLRKKAERAAINEGIKIFIHKISKNATMQKILVSIFGVNWRTSLMGWTSGLTAIGWALVDAYNSHLFDNKHGLVLVMGILAIVKGVVQKDAQVTGLPSDKENQPK